jgi:hypothetical protein
MLCHRLTVSVERADVDSEVAAVWKSENCSRGAQVLFDTLSSEFARCIGYWIIYAASTRPQSGSPLVRGAAQMIPKFPA